jgi:hypothetical protein
MTALKQHVASARDEVPKIGVPSSFLVGIPGTYKKGMVKDGAVTGMDVSIKELKSKKMETCVSCI